MDCKVIAVDFDGTLCEDKWPEIGKPNKELIAYLKNETKNGTKIILWTCRTKDKLENAVNWCKEHGLEFDAVNKNVKEAVNFFGEDTRKVFANQYIDDLANVQFPLPYSKTQKEKFPTRVENINYVIALLDRWRKEVLTLGNETAYSDSILAAAKDRIEALLNIF